jgi:AraC-like DNA-binding protein
MHARQTPMRASHRHPPRIRAIIASTVVRVDIESVRHLYNVLGEGGISLGDWIRERRLEKCRDALTHPAGESGAITDLARQWGFRDASSFGRSFRAAYGMSPREWRQAHSGRTQP